MDLDRYGNKQTLDKIEKTTKNGHSKDTNNIRHISQNTIMRNTDHIIKKPVKSSIVEGLVNPGVH